jgi:hypothetical protein
MSPEIWEAASSGKLIAASLAACDAFFRGEGSSWGRVQGV